ncbi:MAG: 2-oxoacid:acceptor oxidoreductase subunit alpha [Candidatus Thermoplasmatota archaeon]|jgi:2-oxoglutarate ferredoxin oxidoreductase subunit alpha|nr:2-oxoacid:acceptor oxidoreductase subunit alpha [Candidatus Thermoplasmatota archaeon]MCL5788944.1 2-oxoacid:acceptor oxidoreductase subunit alpha [Candidatus Thermoplasmatota archaeon]
MPLVDIDLIIGGPQGGGIDSAAQIVIRAFSIAGYEAYGIREYYSNIKGRHSYFHVRVKDSPVRSLRYPVDLLVCLDYESPFVHMEDVSEKTKVLYDEDLVNTKIEQVLTMEPETKKHIIERLKENGFETTLAGAVNYMKKKGATPYPVSFRNLVVAALGPNKPPARYANTLGASLAMALLGLPPEFTSRGIESVFGRKKEVVEDNEKIVKSGYDFVRSHNSVKVQELPVRPAKQKYILTGNEAVGIGKVIGGLKLQTYYPITPAADESFFLEGHDYFEPVMGEDIEAENEVLKNTGVVVVQAEDEIAAIAMAISGAMTGTRTATGTSGPGFSLMAEAIGYAGINEVPVVVTLYQRGGPSTGLPTRNSQADLLFAINAGHGEFSKIVYSSGDVPEAIEDAIRVFNYAEKFQVPVIHILDKNLANSFFLVEDIDYSRVKIERWKMGEKTENFERFKFTEDGVSPMGLFGKNIIWLTGDEHSELGHITEDPETRDAMMVKRMTKLQTILREIPEEEQVEFIGDKNADVTVLSWGSNKGVILSVFEKLKEEGIKANMVYVKLMNPFPSELVKKYLGGAKIIIDLENNYTGQLATLVRQNCLIEIDNFILKYNGRHTTDDEVYEGIKRILEKKENRVVMVRGA